MAGRGRPGRPPAPTRVIAYIIRRLLARRRAAVRRQRRSRSRSSSWCPGWPARRRRPGLALRRQDRRRRSTIHAMAREARLHRPDATSSTAGSSRASSSAPTSTPAPTIEHCPAPCLGYSFITQNPVLARAARPAAGHALARRRRRGALAGRRRRDRRALGAAARAASSTGPRWASRWPASRCRSSSPACCRCRSSATGSECTAPGGSYTPFTREPADVGLRPAPALDHAGVPVRRRVRPAHPRRHARDDERGLHPHRPGQGPAGARRSSSSTGCARR